MRASNRSIAAALFVTVLVGTGAVIRAEDERPVSYPPVAFPEGYRSWQHVKSIVIGPGHSSFEKRGGIHHYYANDLAVTGYETGKFSNGSIIVDEGVIAKEGEGFAKGMLLENERRSLDVMVKDDRLYKDTGGWGFEHFDGDSRTPGRAPSERLKCYECHAKAQERDHVFSEIRM